MSDAYSELSKLLFRHKKVVGRVLADEDKKYKIQKLNDQISQLQKSDAVVIKPMRKKKLQDHLNWPDDKVLAVVDNLKKHPKVIAKKEKSVVSILSNLFDSLL